MPEESTTPDPVERTRKMYEAATRQDLEATMRFYARDTVFDVSGATMGIHAGLAAVEGLLEDWWTTSEDHHHEVQEIVDFGHGVVFAIVREDGRIVGTDGHVDQRRGWVVLWVRGMIERTTAYIDVDDARAAAERLAESRGT